LIAQRYTYSLTFVIPASGIVVKMLSVKILKETNHIFISQKKENRNMVTHGCIVIFSLAESSTEISFDMIWKTLQLNLSTAELSRSTISKFRISGHLWGMLYGTCNYCHSYPLLSNHKECDRIMNMRRC
jgi:hypothetical protein